MSLAAWIVAFVVAFAAGGAGGIKWEKGQQAQREIAARDHAREIHANQEKVGDVAAVKHEEAKEKIRTEFLVITERIENAKQNEFYAAGTPACLDPDGLRIVNDAAGATAVPASQPASAVPKPAAPSRWNPFRRTGPDASVGKDVQGMPVQAPGNGERLAQMNQRLGSIPPPAEGAVVVRRMRVMPSLSNPLPRTWVVMSLPTAQLDFLTAKEL